jgi:hypothetical protein
MKKRAQSGKKGQPSLYLLFLFFIEFISFFWQLNWMNMVPWPSCCGHGGVEISHVMIR